QGFVDGVNAFLDAAYADATLAKIPHEFFFLPTVIRLQGNGQIPSGVRYGVVNIGGRDVYRPDAWRTTDVTAVAILLAGRFGSGGGRQLRQAALLNYLTAWFSLHGAPSGQTPEEAARDVFEDVRWLDDPNAPTTIPASGAINPVKHGTTPVPLAEADPDRASRFAQLLAPDDAQAGPPDSHLAQHAFVGRLAGATILKGLRAADRLAAEAKELNRRFGLFIHSGSNAWLVSPARSATGNALLWGGPQEGFGNPNIDWEAYVTS